jgi:hypothetical protein
MFLPRLREIANVGVRLLKKYCRLQVFRQALHLSGDDPNKKCDIAASRLEHPVIGKMRVAAFSIYVRVSSQLLITLNCQLKIDANTFMFKLQACS